MKVNFTKKRVWGAITLVTAIGLMSYAMHRLLKSKSDKNQESKTKKSDSEQSSQKPQKTVSVTSYSDVQKKLSSDSRQESNDQENSSQQSNDQQNSHLQNSKTEEKSTTTPTTPPPKSGVQIVQSRTMNSPKFVSQTGKDRDNLKNWTTPLVNEVIIYLLTYTKALSNTANQLSADDLNQIKQARNELIYGLLQNLVEKAKTSYNQFQKKEITKIKRIAAGSKEIIAKYKDKFAKAEAIGQFFEKLDTADEIKKTNIKRYRDMATIFGRLYHPDNSRELLGKDQIKAGYFFAIATQQENSKTLTLKK